MHVIECEQYNQTLMLNGLVVKPSNRANSLHCSALQYNSKVNLSQSTAIVQTNYK